MFKIQVLDCTLRDGGYVNHWRFGSHVIKETIDSLLKTNIDIIELGFLTNLHQYDENETLFSSIDEANNLIQSKDSNTTYVLMINHDEYDLNNLSIGNSSIGIRYAFHKHDLHEALRQSKMILKKGYKLFLQPMVINAYTTSEISKLIDLTNDLQPFAIYIVDSFGVLTPNEVEKYAKKFDSGVKKPIKIGFHSHNNKQFSMANAVAFMNSLDRDIIIDSSIYGMGRGAGNLNTELIIDFINLKRINNNYRSLNLLGIIEKYYYPQQSKTPWGYSLPYYLSAKHSLHPNFAKHLIDLDTLGIEEVERILETITLKERLNYSSKLIQEKYLAYQSSKALIKTKQLESKPKFSKYILIILPGNSYISILDRIIDFIRDGYTLVSVNFIPVNIDIDYVFLSNTKRIHQVKESLSTVIKTSNINFDFKKQNTIRYSDYINELEYVSDNALLMLLSYLNKFTVNKISIAGLDGYDPVYRRLNTDFTKESSVDVNILSKNENIRQYLEEYGNVRNINFITPSKFIKFD